MTDCTGRNVSRRRRSNRGSATVELALIGTIFFTLLIGVMDVGQVLFIQQAMVERARAAARWGAVNDPANTAAIQNMVLYLQPAAPVNGTPSFGLNASMVNVSTAEAGTDNYRLVVQISGYSSRILSPGISGSYRGAPIRVSVPLGLYR